MKKRSGTFVNDPGPCSPLVVIGAPEALPAVVAQDLKTALEVRQAQAIAFRADTGYRHADFKTACAGKTHLVLVVNGEVDREERMIEAAEEAGISKAVIICLEGSHHLRAHQRFLESGRAQTVVVRRFDDNGIVGKITHRIVAQDIQASVGAIARAIVPQLGRLW